MTSKTTLTQCDMCSDGIDRTTGARTDCPKCGTLCGDCLPFSLAHCAHQSCAECGGDARVAAHDDYNFAAVRAQPTTAEIDALILGAEKTGDGWRKALHCIANRARRVINADLIQPDPDDITGGETLRELVIYEMPDGSALIVRRDIGSRSEIWHGRTLGDAWKRALDSLEADSEAEAAAELADDDDQKGE